jgi:hypothetical protein
VLTKVVEDHHKSAIEGLLKVVLDRRNEWKSLSSCELDGCNLTVGPWKMLVKK